MRHTEDSIKKIKRSLSEMWLLVQGQMDKASIALLEGDKDAAHHVMGREKLVDSYELAIDRECENFFALLTPVAVDLRMMLSIIKINNNLERIGDFANGISKFVASGDLDAIDNDLKEQLRLKEMTTEVITMFELCKQAFLNEDAAIAGRVFAKDNFVDEINESSTKILEAYMKKNPDKICACLNIHSALRRIERIGDRCNNIAEDIIFYLEARVLKHHE